MAHGNISTRAQAGFAKATAYDQYRPSYGAKSVQILLEQCRVAGVEKAKIVDLAAGTGKFTEALSSRPEGFDIIAIEPHDEMREVLAAKSYAGVSVRAGTAASTGLQDESVDAVLVAQAFHWFANMDTLKELHRILKPHGVLGMIWNVEDYNAPRGRQASTPWEHKLHDLIWTFEDNQPRFRHEKWREVFDEQLKTTPLSLLIASDQLFSLPLAEHEEPFETLLSKDEVWARYNTLSQIATLEGGERERTYKTFTDAVNASDVTTDSEGRLTVHGSTTTAWTSKIPQDGRGTLTGVERDTPAT